MTRGRPYNRPIATVQKLATKLHSSIFRATDGKIGGTLAGGPVLLLVTTGRKTGQRRTTPLLYLMDGDRYVIVASNGGAPKDPVWWLNLKANPEATVEVGDRTLRVRAEAASPEEKARLWPGLVKMYGGYEGYQRKTDRTIPVVILHPMGT
ncbi:MAG: nitroreductase family deazaflavin-dependent oxidoreductase [Rubrobacter sp.]|nr:nitroreductase family deazaflavin-dependent oxidoreductase [Rubrobacter sp.]